MNSRQMLVGAWKSLIRLPWLHFCLRSTPRLSSAPLLGMSAGPIQVALLKSPMRTHGPVHSRTLTRGRCLRLAGLPTAFIGVSPGQTMSILATSTFTTRCVGDLYNIRELDYKILLFFSLCLKPLNAQ